MPDCGGPNVPAAPANLQATAVSSSQINLTWKENSDHETGFKIERKAPGRAYIEIETAGAGATGYRDTGLTCQTIYYYRVRAYNTAGNSNYSQEANVTTGACPITVPAAPSGLTATVVSSTQINLDWKDNSDNEEGFYMKRKTGSGGTYAQAATVGVGVTGYQDLGLDCDTEYHYRSSAYNSAGNSDYSNEVTAPTNSCPESAPQAPASLEATSVSASQINLSWTDNSDNEDGFKIERKTGAGGTYSQAGATGSDATSYSDTGLLASTAYYYRVYAYNSIGNSGYSDEVSATTRNGGTLGPAVSIPDGCFNMGDAFNEGYADEFPVHNVCISAFQMEIYEVTNAQYRACVEAGSCTAPGSSSSNTRSSYYGNSIYDNYPVIYVDLSQALAYCLWAGGRFPTEAEWEYAARGGLAGKRYPWGDNDPTCALGANNGAQDTDCSPGDTIEVGSFAPNGYGLYDLAGNVDEWASDWYDKSYYSTSSTQDPPGSSSGTYRCLRGGRWNNIASNLRASVRRYNLSTFRYFDLGFRCAK